MARLGGLRARPRLYGDALRLRAARGQTADDLPHPNRGRPWRYLFDTAQVYGPLTNEDLVGEALAPVREQVVIATKFGWNLEQPGTLNSDEYERVRGQRDRFAVVPGHESDEIERVVETAGRYVIVDKRDEAEPFVQ